MSSEQQPTLPMQPDAGAARPDAPRLVVVAGQRPGERVTLAAEVTTIGRDAGNDLVLASSVVSAFHARVERRDEAFVLRDVGSTNGVSVNGSPLERDGPGHALHHGDVVTLSDHVLLFLSRPSSADHVDLASIQVDRAGAEAQAEAFLQEFPFLRRERR